MAATSLMVSRAEEFVGLNISGVVYNVSRSLLNRHPHSTLCAIANQAPDEETTDKDGNYRIDGDCKVFRHILNFIRHGTLCVPQDFKQHELLRAEATFYNLPALRRELDRFQYPKECNKSDKSEVEVPLSVGQGNSFNNVIEAYVMERDGMPQRWRIHGHRQFLEDIPTLEDYMAEYRKGSQCLEFTVQHSMYPGHVFRRFPKTQLFYEICNCGFRLHTTDSITINDEDDDRLPWLRYVFTHA